MTPLDEIRRSLVREWIASARDDLAWAEMGAANPTLPGPAQMGFHAQQAVEKLLKGLLTAYGVEPEEQHNLGRLIEQVRRLDRSTGDAVSEAGQLTPFAVHYRYPPRIPTPTARPTRTQALNAVDIARRVAPVIEAAITRRLAAARSKNESE